MSSSYISISVDDGHETDLKSAEILNKYNLKATFYIPKNNPERTVMVEGQVKDLNSQFEVGAHTISHLPLNNMTNSIAYNEIVDSKKWLENILGKECVSFCYPQGKFNFNTAKLVKKAGFLGARNCFFNRVDFSKDIFQVGVSTHAYSHSGATQVRHALKERNFLGLINYFKIYKYQTNWVEHFKMSIDHVKVHGGVAHLFFHSWEIDKNGHWNELEYALKYAKDSNIRSITNGELFNIIKNNE